MKYEGTRWFCGTGVLQDLIGVIFVKGSRNFFGIFLSIYVIRGNISIQFASHSIIISALRTPLVKREIHGCAEERQLPLVT